MKGNIQQTDFGRNGKLINKTSQSIRGQQYTGISVDNNIGLRLDQSPGEASYYIERQKPFTVNNYQNGTIVSNTPSRKDVENTVKKQLNSRLERPEIVYKKIVDDTRTLPYIPIIEPQFSMMYSNAIIINFTNLYVFAPKFYLNIVQNPKNFIDYQKFIYLLIIIRYADEHRDDFDFLSLDANIKNLIEWCKLKRMPDIDFYIQGPQCPTNYVSSEKEIKSESDKLLIFSQIYSGLVSTSNVVSDISNYLQVTEQQNMNKHLNGLNERVDKRPNAFDKLLNYAGSYTLSLDTAQNCKFAEDENNNLIVDFGGIGIGNSNSEPINLNLNEAEITTKPLKYDPKITNHKLMNIMNRYTNFTIKNLLISKQTYKTSLDAFDKLYVVFPGITMDGRFNQVYTTGTLQISGHFITNQNSKFWEFVPDNDSGITYNPTTVNVESSKFYISDCPTSKNSLSYYAYETMVKADNYYNCPIVVQALDSSYMDTYIIRINSINSGKVVEKSYSLLYNRSIGTIQLLKDSYNFENIPRIGMKGKFKITHAVEEQFKPIMPVTRETVIRETRIAFEKGNQGVILPNPIQPVTTKSIEYLQSMNQQSFEFSGKTYPLFEIRDSNAYARDPKILVAEINNTTYYFPKNAIIVNNLQSDFNNAIINKQYAVEVNNNYYAITKNKIGIMSFDQFVDHYKFDVQSDAELQALQSFYNHAIENKQYVVVIPIYNENLKKDELIEFDLLTTNIQYYNYEEFAARNNFLDINLFANKIYQLIEDNYSRALKSYNAVDQAEYVNRMNLRSDVSDFTSTREYMLFNGLFIPDYDYDVEFGTEGAIDKGIYVDYLSKDQGNYTYNIEDFYEIDEQKNIIFKEFYTKPDDPSSGDINVEGDNINNIILVNGEKNFTIQNPINNLSNMPVDLISGISIGYIENDNYHERKLYSLNAESLKITLQQPTRNVELEFENIWVHVVYDSEDDYFSRSQNYHIELSQRNVDFEKNIYKTYKINTDLFDLNFTIDDFIYSYIKLMNKFEIYGKTYTNINELNLEFVTDDTRNMRPGLFDKPMEIKYFINYIEQNKLNLLINKPKFDFNTLDVKFKDESYILETINNNLFMINYQKPLDGPDVVYSKGSRFKVVIEMK